MISARFKLVIWHSSGEIFPGQTEFQDASDRLSGTYYIHKDMFFYDFLVVGI